MNNIVTILPEGCLSFNHIVSKFCLPLKTTCDNTVVDGLFTNCGDQWNCNVMCAGDSRYYAPVPSDGKIMFQTNFNRFDNSTGWGDNIGVNGWITIILIDELGEEIENAIQHASRHITGKSTKHSYQTIEIDVSTIGVDCFGFKITDDTDTVCTQFFRKAPCSDLVEIEGVFTKFDCWNNYYGLAEGTFSGTDFNYSNKVYLKGINKYFGGNADLGDDIIKQYYRVHPSEKIAPFMMKYLLNKILIADDVIIDSGQYINEGSGKYSPSNGSMFFPIMEFVKTCESTSVGACEN